MQIDHKFGGESTRNVTCLAHFTALVKLCQIFTESKPYDLDYHTFEDTVWLMLLNQVSCFGISTLGWGKITEHHIASFVTGISVHTKKRCAEAKEQI